MWAISEVVVPKKCTPSTPAIWSSNPDLGHKKGKLSWAHLPNCLHGGRGGNLGLVVVWVYKEWTEHCVVLYSTCERHCPGHVIRKAHLVSSFHNFDDWVRHCQLKERQTDQQAEQRAGEQKKIREQIAVQNTERAAICTWASKKNLGRLAPQVWPRSSTQLPFDPTSTSTHKHTLINQFFNRHITRASV